MTQRRSFRHTPESVAAARRFVAELLAHDGATAELVETAQLLVSELATNCIRHTDSGFELRVSSRRGEIRIEATDFGAGMPALRSPQLRDPSGRGLRIVDMLSSAWGVKRGRSGKTVWFTLAGAARSSS